MKKVSKVFIAGILAAGLVSLSILLAVGTVRPKEANPNGPSPRFIENNTFFPLSISYKTKDGKDAKDYLSMDLGTRKIGPSIRLDAAEIIGPVNVKITIPPKLRSVEDWAKFVGKAIPEDTLKQWVMRMKDITHQIPLDKLTKLRLDFTIDLNKYDENDRVHIVWPILLAAQGYKPLIFTIKQNSWQATVYNAWRSLVSVLIATTKQGAIKSYQALIDLTKKFTKPQPPEPELKQLMTPPKVHILADWPPKIIEEYEPQR